jgi:Ca-activated chloride channel family protein
VDDRAGVGHAADGAFSAAYGFQEAPMTFGNPQMLWLLLVFPPAMLTFFYWAWRQRQALMTQFIQTRLLPGLTIGISPRRQKIRLACVTLAVVCLIIALARPQLGFDWEEAKQRGLDIVVAIDTSKSMLAEDIAPNRLARAKLAALDLMQQARSDRLGLVAFAGSAFLQCPLTIDDGAFRQSVDALDVNIIPQGGTALAEAIEAALTAFKEGDNHKILVLMTDGEDHDSGAVEAATKAAEAGLKIFTIGIGSKEGELLRVKDAKGRSDYIRDEQGNVVKSHLNESLLQEIAGAAKGVYYPLRGAKTMDTLYRDWLAPLPKSDSEEKLIRRPHERYHWPLALGMLLLIVEMLLPERKRESPAKVMGRASRVPSTPPKSAASAVAAALILLALPIIGFGSPGSALREYKAGQYDQALKEYEKLIEKKGDDPRLRFNAGAAAYRNGKFEEAAKQFDEAVAAPDLKLQQHAYFNRGNTLYHVGESNPDPNNRQETWKKAIQDYENAMKINPQDADAKFNRDFVKKRLEELKQQQQQSNKNKNDQNQDQNQNQDQQQQQNQQKDDQKKDQQQNSQQDQQKQQDQNQSQQKQDQQKQDAQKQKDEEQKQQQAKAEQQKKDQQEKQQQQQQAKPSKSKPDDQQSQDQQQMAAAVPGQMTPQQAQQILDSEKGEEQMLPSKPNPKPTDPNKPVKDW